MQICQECGKESKYIVCAECFNKAVNELSEESCHNCDAKCKGCEPYHFEDDETKVYNDLNETK